MSNAPIIELFNEIADWLELKGGDLFRIRSYQKAARGGVQMTAEVL